MKTARTETVATDRFVAVRGARTSAEYRTAIAVLSDELNRLEQEHSEAERRRDRAIIDGGDMAGLRLRVVGLATDVSDVRTAIAEAVQRQGEAETREFESETQDLAAEAKGLGGELRDVFLTFDAALQALREAHANVDRLRGRLSSVNDSLEARGKSALRTKAANVRDATGEGVSPPMVGLSRNGQRLDTLLRDIGRPRTAIRVNPRHRRLGGEVRIHV